MIRMWELIADASYLLYVRLYMRLRNADELICYLHITLHQPMRLARVAEPFDRADFLYELKYDGFRALAVVEGGKTRLISRRGNVYKRFETAAEEISHAMSRRDAVLDGEIVCLDSDGRPQFYDLLRRRGEPHFVAFDIVHLDGRDLRAMPLWKRKAILRGVLRDGGPVLYARHIEHDGRKLFALACALDLEGIVAKHREGVYLDGTTGRTSWVKIKNRTYSQAEGRRELFEKRQTADEP